MGEDLNMPVQVERKAIRWANSSSFRRTKCPRLPSAPDPRLPSAVWFSASLSLPVQRYSDLGLTAVDEQFDTVDKARVVGGQKDCRLGNFVGIADAAHWDPRGQGIDHSLLPCGVGAGQTKEAWRLGRSGTKRVDPDAATLEIENPVAGE